MRYLPKLIKRAHRNSRQTCYHTTPHCRRKEERKGEEAGGGEERERERERERDEEGQYHNVKSTTENTNTLHDFTRNRTTVLPVIHFREGSIYTYRKR